MITDRINELARECGYAAEPDDVDYEVDDSVDALIGYKDGLEDLASSEGETLDKLAAFLWANPEQFPGGADTCEALDRALQKTGRLPEDFIGEEYRR